MQSPNNVLKFQARERVLWNRFRTRRLILCSENLCLCLPGACLLCKSRNKGKLLFRIWSLTICDVLPSPKHTQGKHDLLPVRLQVLGDYEITTFSHSVG